MEKKELTKMVFDVLHQSYLVFKKEDFNASLRYALGGKVNLHESAAADLLKQLVSKSYLNQDGEYFIKTPELLNHIENRQCQLLKDLIEDDGSDFDIDYIRNEYVKYLKKSEQTPGLYDDYAQSTFDFVKETLIKANVITINKTSNQFESPIL